jgi:hypothetical protein
MKYYYNKLVQMYHDSNNLQINYYSEAEEFLPRLYLLYNYFNGDETYLDEIEEQILKNENFKTLIASEYDEDTFEFTQILDLSVIDEIEIVEKLNDADEYLKKLLNKQEISKHMVEKIKEINLKDDSNIRVLFLTDNEVNQEDVSRLKDIITNYKSKIQNVSFNIYFKEDISELIDDVENPKLNVEKSTLKLLDDGQIFYHGLERSLIISISAKSLKEVYLKHSTKGLFSSNLRYYVKSSKIDKDIKFSIEQEPDNFWYFNNGIIITASNYDLFEDQITLNNFSIVNGGQTTNLIGNSSIEIDFPILCKVIIPRTSDSETNENFLAKVAETSNTQKPIKARDLIANRPEQRKFKTQYKKIDVFLHVKRGEKIDKTMYPEKWQNASNDEVGQMIFSFVYQRPGSAKNSKSAMLMNKDYYKLIYEGNYSDSLLLSFQHFKVQFNKWKAAEKKSNLDQNKIAIASNSIFMFYGIAGFLAKLLINKKSRDYFFSLPSFIEYDKEVEFTQWLALNDVSYTDVFVDPALFASTTSAYRFFDFIYDNFVRNAYTSFKNKNPNFGPGHFTKSDKYYINHVIREILLKTKNKFNDSEYIDFFKTYYISESKVKLSVASPEDATVKLGLKEELMDYRSRMFKANFIKAYEIFTNAQLDSIVFNKPKNIDELKNVPKFDYNRIEKYGNDIINIVKKYLFE